MSIASVFKSVSWLKTNVSPCCCMEVEKLARTLFLWKIEVHVQKEKVYEMRRWNEALVTNMLPEHVARHFLGSKKRDEVRSHSQTPSHSFSVTVLIVIMLVRSPTAVVLYISTNGIFLFPENYLVRTNCCIT